MMKARVYPLELRELIERMKLVVTRKGRWVVREKASGVLVSQHDTVDNAIESAANSGVACVIVPPSYEVVVQK